MGFFDKLFNTKAAKPLPANDASLQLLNRALYNYLGNQTIYNPDSPQSYVDLGFLYNADVYSIVKRIAKTAASCPFVLHEIQDSSAAYKYQTMSSMKGQEMHKLEKLRTKAFAPVSDHPAMQLLMQPNPDQSGFSFWESYHSFRLLLGNSYLYGAGPDSGNNAGQFQELYILPAHLMQIVAGNIMDPVTGYRMLYRGSTEILPKERVMHGRTFSPDYSGPASHLYGLSPLRAASMVLQRGNDSMLTASKMLTNMGANGAIFIDDSNNNFSEEQQQSMEAKYNQKYGGPNKAGSVIISNSKIGFTNFGMSPIDLQLIEQEKLTLRQLCSIYGVSSSLFNDADNRTFNNVAEARKELICNAVLPEMVALRDDLNRFIIKTYKNPKLYLDFDLSVFPELAEDLGKMATLLQVSYWITPNEKRQAMGYAPLEDENMDKVILTNTMISIDDLSSIPALDPTELAAAIKPVDDSNKV